MISSILSSNLGVTHKIVFNVGTDFEMKLIFNIIFVSHSILVLLQGV